MLRYFMRVKSTEVLGFGDRCAIWTSGCSKNPPCKGCLLNTHHKTNTRSETAEEVIKWVLSCKNATGITVSGGEPFDQALALADVLEKVKQIKGEAFSVILYTGSVYEALLEEGKSDVDVQRLLSLVDILIDGPYVEELDDNIPFRGSSNQRILILNDRFRDEASAYYTCEPGRKIEFTNVKGETLLVGVPSKNQLSSWKAMISDEYK